MLYYFEEATMKQIGAAIGVNESRVSQLHARAVTRLKQALEAGPSRQVKPTLVARRAKSAPQRMSMKPAAAPTRRRLRQVA